MAVNRFRVPDTMVLRAGHTVRRIVQEAPLVCIEVISSEDRWGRLQGVLGDYLAMGVRHIWAFDPEERRAYQFDDQGFHAVTDRSAVEGTLVVLWVDEVFPGE